MVRDGLDGGALSFMVAQCVILDDEHLVKEEYCLVKFLGQSLFADGNIQPADDLHVSFHFRLVFFVVILCGFHRVTYLGVLIYVGGRAARILGPNAAWDEGDGLGFILFGIHDGVAPVISVDHWLGETLMTCHSLTVF